MANFMLHSLERHQKKNVRIKIQQTERQGRFKENSDKVLNINCVYREIYEVKILYSDRNKVFQTFQMCFR
jgi:hypothetical protein